MVPEYGNWLVRRIDPDPYALFGERGLHQCDRFGNWRAKVEFDMRPVARPTKRAKPIQEAFDTADLHCGYATKLLDELPIVLTPWKELRECLDSAKRIPDLVRYTGGEHLEVGEFFSFSALRLELLQRREVAEHSDG